MSTEGMRKCSLCASWFRPHPRNAYHQRWCASRASKAGSPSSRLGSQHALGRRLHLPPAAEIFIDQTPAGGVAGLMYVSFVRVPDPAMTGMPAVNMTPSAGMWRIHAPPAGYAGPLCGTGSLAAVQCPAGNYTISFADLAMFRTPEPRSFVVEPAQVCTVSVSYVSRQLGDYDGDGRADFALFDRSAGRWYVLAADQRSLIAWGLEFGWTGAIPVPGAVW